MQQVVGQKGPGAVGGVPGKQQPAEFGHAFTALAGTVQLYSGPQHEELEGLQEPVLLLPTLEDLLADSLPLPRPMGLHSILPLWRKKDTLCYSCLYVYMFVCL